MDLKVEIKSCITVCIAANLRVRCELIKSSTFHGIINTIKESSKKRKKKIESIQTGKIKFMLMVH